MTPHPLAPLRRVGAPLPGIVAPLAVLTALRVMLLVVFPTDLMFDEAQYWVWSRHLQWGYYSKPPLIAWIIRAVTALAGNAEWAVRLPSPVFHGLAALGIHAAVHALFDDDRGWSHRQIERMARAGAALYALAPGVTLGATMMTTDAPLLAAWAWAMALSARAARARGRRAVATATAAGVVGGLGLLAKYTMLAALPVLVAFVATAHGGDRRGGVRRAIAMAGAACAVVAPHAAWVVGHGLVTVHHTLGHVDGVGAGLHVGRALAFAGAQLGVFGPVGFVAMTGALAVMSRNRRGDARARLVTLLSAPLLLTMTVLAALDHAWANWAAPAYVGGSIAVALVLSRRPAGWRVLRLALGTRAALSLVVVVLAIAASSIPAAPPRAFDAFRRRRGQRELARRIDAVARSWPGHALLFDSRHVMAPVVYYLWRRHGRRPLVARWDEDARPDDGFATWAPLSGIGAGGDVLLVTGLARIHSIRRRFRHATRLDDIRTAAADVLAPVP